MEETTPEQSPKKSMSPMLIVAAVVVVLALAGVAFVMMQNSKKATTTTTTPEAQPTAAMTQESEATTGATQAGTEKAFEIDGSNFKFAPNTLSVNVGDTVTITFKNTQGFHNFLIDEFSAKSKTINAGQEDVLTFVASKKGSFEYYCGVGNHRAMGMVGTITVQ